MNEGGYRYEEGNGKKGSTKWWDKIFYRCPHCGKKREMMVVSEKTAYCWFCGREFRFR